MIHNKKLIHIPFYLLLLILILLENCGKTEEEKPNKAPACNITSPANNDAITLGTTVTITVSATDTDGSISNVKISIDGTTVATLQTSPYTYDWNTADEATGPHNIKAVATDDGGLTGMSQITVDLTALAPTVTTGDVTEITGEAAKCSGDVTSDGGDAVTARGFVWGTSATPTLEDNEGSAEAGAGTGAFSAAISGLMPVTEYYVRAYATNSSGTSYGDAKMFKTLEGPPVVKTMDVGNVSAHWAISSVDLISNGGDSGIQLGIVWSQSQNPDYDNNDGIYTNDTANFDGSLRAYQVVLSALKENTIYYARAYGKNRYGIRYGEEITLTTEAFTVQTGQFTDDRDGKQYKTAEIYGQVWMAENLAYLPQVCPSDNECGYWVYDYQGSDVAAAKAAMNYTGYGVLYNWETAQSACPTGWHLPTHEEWALLEVNIGMDYSDATSWFDAYRGVDEGAKLKETGNTYWDNANGTNITLFNARGAGMRLSSNTFSFLRQNANFWTASVYINGNHINYRALSNNDDGIGSYMPNIQAYPWEKKLGYSVRCVKD